MQKNSHARVISFSRAQKRFLCACKSHQENQCKNWKITIFTDDYTIFQILSWWVLHEPFMLNMVRKSTERFGNLSLEKYGILTNKICFCQDVFKEARPNESADVKNETEVHVRSRRLPITRKFYAFYHAPIVKFWFNTVRTVPFSRCVSVCVISNSLSVLGCCSMW